MANWNVEERLKKDLADLRHFIARLQRCATFAAEHADAEKTKPGNRRPEWLEIAVGGFRRAVPSGQHKTGDGS